jgi:hypothetical protein
VEGTAVKARGLKSFTGRKEIPYDTDNYSSGAFVRRRRRVFRVFQMGNRRGLGIVGTVLLILLVLYLLGELR